jgi:hypothetical protein
VEELEPPFAASTGGLVQEPLGCHSWRRREAQEWGKNERRGRGSRVVADNEAGAAAQGSRRREPGGSKHHYSMLLPLPGAWFLNNKALLLLNASVVHLAHEVFDQMHVP